MDISVSDEGDVWKELKFDEVFLIPQGDEEKIVYVVLTAKCSWDEEHGIQFVFRRGNELTRITE